MAAKRARFTDVPNWNGEPLLVCDNDESYEFYIDWLADYLFDPKIRSRLSAKRS
jgi:hypothetical protein